MPPDYLITTALDSDTKRERIVRAKNEAAALKHVVADTITIARASIDDAIRLTKDGGTVETAGAA